MSVWSRRGATLPLTILVIAVLGVSVAITRGATIAGLNVKLGQAVGVSDMNGNKDFQYDSCALTRALGHIGSLQRVRNGWIDTWASY